MRRLGLPANRVPPAAVVLLLEYIRRRLTEVDGMLIGKELRAQGDADGYEMVLRVVCLL
jgi:hypothetical protein